MESAVELRLEIETVILHHREQHDRGRLRLGRGSLTSSCSLPRAISCYKVGPDRTLRLLDRRMAVAQIWSSLATRRWQPSARHDPAGRSCAGRCHRRIPAAQHRAGTTPRARSSIRSLLRHHRPLVACARSLGVILSTPTPLKQWLKQRLKQRRHASRIRPFAATATIWTDGDSAPRRGEERPEAGTARRAVVINKSHDFAKLEREYITSQISIRELCRRNGITAHSLVTVQAKKGKWAEKREQYQAKASEAYIERYAARQADREAEVRDKALDAIDKAITRFRSDLKATEKKLVDGEWVEVPVLRLTPRDLAALLDRLQVLFDRPSRISEGRDLGVSSQLPIDALNQLVELTRGREAPPVSPLPKGPRRLDD